MSPEKSNNSLAVRSLDDFDAGSQVRIVSIHAGSGLKNRLASMGLLVNVPVRVIRNDRVGQIIVQVKNSKMILGRGMSHKVFAAEL